MPKSQVVSLLLSWSPGWNLTGFLDYRFRPLEIQGNLLFGSLAASVKKIITFRVDNDNFRTLKNDRENMTTLRTMGQVS